MPHLLGKFTKGLSLILCVILLLSALGCGGQGETGADDISVGDVSHENMENTVISTEWKTKGFSYKENFGIFDVLENTAPYQEIRGSDFKETEPEFGYEEKRSVVAYLRETCYILYSYEQGQGQRFILEKRRSDVEKPERLEVFDEPNPAPVGYVACMDVVTESDIAVLFVSLKGDWRGEVEEYLLLHLDEEGKVLSQTELFDSYQKEGIERNDLVQGLWQCDEQGNSYVLTNESRKLTIFDAQGNLVMHQDFSGEEGVAVKAAFHAPDGSLIFSLTDLEQGATRLVWLDVEKKQCRELASIATPDLRQFTMLENGQIYYSRGSSLVKWDIQTGKQELVFSYLASDIPDSMFEYVEHVSVTKEELIIYVVRRNGVDIRVLSDKVQETEGITLVDFCGISYVQSCAAGYSRGNGDTAIQYQKSSGDEEAFWNRIMAELAAGKGPDILCLWAGDEHLQTLYEKGVLADLTELVPDEILTQIFPGILESGSIDGSLVGLGASGMPITLITSNKLWQQDNWTIEDIERIVEAQPDLEGMFISNDRTMSPLSNFYFMSLHHMESSPFLSVEKRESYFEGMAFQRALELAKIYGEAPAPSGEVGALIKEGRCIATLREINFADKFVEVVEEYGEECHFIGYPGQTDYSGYWSSVFLIVVNKKSEYLESITEFLQYLLASENQQKLDYAISVRKDVVRQNVFWNEWSQTWCYKAGENGSWEFTKQNGDSYIEDYVEFLRKLGPWEGSHTVISDIVSEEAEDYFNGVRSAEETAEIIDNRVQLYLDEG